MPLRKNVTHGSQALVIQHTVLEVEELSALALLGLTAAIILRAA